MRRSGVRARGVDGMLLEIPQAPVSGGKAESASCFGDGPSAHFRFGAVEGGRVKFAEEGQTR